MDLTSAHALANDLRDLHAASGSNAKKELAATWTRPHHLEFLDLVGNTDRVFYVTWAAVSKASPVRDGVEWDDLWREAQMRLATPTTTAGRVQALLQAGWPESVLKAIVEKTLDSGITVKEVNKARGVRKPFAVALAKSWYDIKEEKRQAMLEEGEYCTTPKMDGLRALLIIAPGRYQALSRHMKPLKNMERHLKALAEMFKDFPCVIDGEGMAEDWNESVTALKKSSTSVQAQFYPFDLIPLDEFDTGKFAMRKKERLQILNDHLDYDNPLFRKVHFNHIFTCKQVDRFLQEHLAQGFEGSVLHDMHSVYRPFPDKVENRTTSLLKVKVWRSAEFRVRGFVEGKGKHAGRLGTLVLEGNYCDPDSGSIYPVFSESGGGFSDEEREEIWNNQAKWLNALVEIKFFSVSEPDKSTGTSKLRFPTYLKRRRDLE